MEEIPLIGAKVAGSIFWGIDRPRGKSKNSGASIFFEAGKQIEFKMNYAEYMRKVQNTKSQIIGFQNGQDASLVTLKAQARAQTVKTPVAVATSFSKIGGTVGNIMQTSQQTSSPTSETCATGYRGVAQGTSTTDATANVLGAKQRCAVCSDAPSSAPYSITIPCGIFIEPPKNAPGTVKCCQKDSGQVVNTATKQELVNDLGRQATLRKAYNLPAKLQGLRGPVVNLF